mgnify:CR=1 FL=1
MKKKLLRLLLIGCVLASTLFIGGAALAQDEELPDPGITPDSPFYFMDKLSKGLGMAFAFGDEAKAKAKSWIDTKVAETEAEIEAMVNEGVRRAYLDPANPLRASIVARAHQTMSSSMASSEGTMLSSIALIGASCPIGLTLKKSAPPM